MSDVYIMCASANDVDRHSNVSSCMYHHLCSTHRLQPAHPVPAAYNLPTLYLQVIEAARAFGNFSRAEDVREMMLKEHAAVALVLLLDHSERELVFTAAGVLMNLATDEAVRQFLRRRSVGGVQKLLDLLPSAWEDAPEIASVTCKALYNFSIGWRGAADSDGSGSASPSSLDDSKAFLPRFSDDQCLQLLQSLADFLIEAEDAGVMPAGAVTGDHALDDAREEYQDLVNVAGQLRDEVKSMVQAGAVTDTETETEAMSASQGGVASVEAGPSPLMRRHIRRIHMPGSGGTETGGDAVTVGTGTEEGVGEGSDRGRVLYARPPTADSRQADAGDWEPLEA